MSITTGVRLFFRLFSATLAGCVMLLFITPRKVCPYYDRYTIINTGRGCIPSEFKHVACPYFELFQPTPIPTESSHLEETTSCPIYAPELIWPPAISLFFLVAIVLDMMFGKRIRKWRHWTEKRRYTVYLIFAIVSIVVWFSIVIAMGYALDVRWPQALNHRKATDQDESDRMNQFSPPITWVAAMIFAVMGICVNVIEIASMHLYPEQYFDKDRPPKCSKKFELMYFGFGNSRSQITI